MFVTGYGLATCNHLRPVAVSLFFVIHIRQMAAVSAAANSIVGRPKHTVAGRRRLCSRLGLRRFRSLLQQPMEAFYWRHGHVSTMTLKETKTIEKKPVSYTHLTLPTNREV